MSSTRKGSLGHKQDLEKFVKEGICKIPNLTAMPPGPGPDDPVEVPQLTHGDPLLVRGEARGLGSPASEVRDVQVRLGAANLAECWRPHLLSEHIRG